MSRSLRRRLALGLALALAGAARVAASDVRAVLSSDSGHYRQAYEGFQEEWGSTVPYFVLGEASLSGRPDVVVAFGSRAALREWPETALLVTCLAPGARPTRRGDLLRMELLPAPEILSARLKRLLPGLKILRVVWSSDFEREEVAGLSAAARAQGVEVLSERVDPARLPEGVRAFAGRADALWLMPDPGLVNAENFAVLREYAAAARTPFLAPTEGLAEKGATATLAVPFRDVGRAAAAALKARLRGALAATIAHPDRLVVTINAEAARSIGLDLKAAGGVDRTIP